MSDWKAALVERLRIGALMTSPERVVDAEDLNAFNRGTWLDLAYPDPDPDEYGDDMIPGFMSLALFDALGTMTSRDRPSGTYALNYGLDRVRFVHPVRAGDVVAAEFVVRSVAERSNGILVTRDCTLRVGPDREVAVVAELLSLHRPRAVPRSDATAPD